MTDEIVLKEANKEIDAGEKIVALIEITNTQANKLVNDRAWRETNWDTIVDRVVDEGIAPAIKAAMKANWRNLFKFSIEDVFDDLGNAITGKKNLRLDFYVAPNDSRNLAKKVMRAFRRKMTKMDENGEKL